MASAVQVMEGGETPVRVSARRESPEILRIDRYNLKPGTEPAVRNLQKRAAIAMAEWDSPHPCLVIESLTGPKQIWSLKGFESIALQKEVVQRRANDEAVRRALDRIESQVQVLTGRPETVIARYHGGASRGRAWWMGRGHYLIIGTFVGNRQKQGTLYRTGTGEQYLITAVRIRKDAEVRASEVGPEAHIFVIRPTWGMPAADWTKNDPAFWNSSPVAKRAARRSLAFLPR